MSLLRPARNDIMLMKSKLPLLLALSLFLFGCLPTSNLWGYSVKTEPLPTQTFTFTPTTTQTPPPTATVTPTLTSTPALIQRVLIVSFDGLRPDSIQEAPMDNLLALMQSGAYTLSAQTIFPSTTLPAHSSMLGGVCPAKHHVIWNEYIPENGFARGTDLFDAAHAAGLKTVMLVGKEKLRQLTEPASTDVFEAFDFEDFEVPENDITARAIQEVDSGFDLMFVHFPSGDLMGHEYGWTSDEQLSTFQDEDASLGKILAELSSNGMSGTTLIVALSDHGGHDTTHGFNQPEDMTIPWVISGPGIQPIQLTTAVQVMDTAATAAYALGLSIPEEWDGIPVTEAFGLPAEIRDAAVCP